MQSSSNARSFILRSEIIEAAPQDRARRDAIISALADVELDRIAGGTNNNLTVDPTWRDDRPDQSSCRCDS